MSTCGSCRIYDETAHGVHCPGGLGKTNGCADNLQDLVDKLEDQLKELREEGTNNPLDAEEWAYLTDILKYFRQGLHNSLLRAPSDSTRRKVLDGKIYLIDSIMQKLKKVKE